MTIREVEELHGDTDWEPCSDQVVREGFLEEVTSKGSWGLRSEEHRKCTLGRGTSMCNHSGKSQEEPGLCGYI